MFKKDFGLDAEWHYFSTSHGKSPCDALGGAFKRNAKLHNMRNPNDQINSSKKLFDWSQTIENSKVHFVHCDEEEYLKVKEHLRTEHFSQNIKQVPGSQSFHSFKPIDEKTVEARTFSDSAESKEFKLIR